MSVVTIERKVLARNDEIAARNRAVFKERGIHALNLISSPGSGKTSLLERLLDGIAARYGVAVIEGDLQTDLDARRVARYGVPVVQIVTNGGCHLDAQLVSDALERLDLDGVRLLVIENVGNLVCPAAYDLGEDEKMAILSVVEGDDKPLKYPAVLHRASALVINKIDLLPYVHANLATLRANALRINPRLEILETSCATNAGIDGLCAYVTARVVAAPRSP